MFNLYRKELLVISLLAVVAVLSAADILHDMREGASTAHLALESVLVTAALGLIVVLASGVWRESRNNAALKQELAARAAAPEAASEAVRAARHELANVTQVQFETWNLTGTEREIAMLLLKGLSFKEIAAVRSTAEKTVRQQASSIYGKSGVAGRHEFAAWFIEDFL